MFKITTLKSSDIKVLESILLKYKYKPYQQYFSKSNVKELNIYFFEKIKNILSNKRNENLFAINNDKTTGILSWAEALWDSQQLGIKMARINRIICQNSSVTRKLLDSVVKKCRLKNIKYLFYRLNADDLSTLSILKEAGFQVQDVIVKLCFDVRSLRGVSGKNNFILIRSAKSKDLPLLRKIARTSFIYDRFHSDSKLSKKRSDELHAAWISNSFRGLADIVLVAELNKKVVGFITCKVDKLSKRKLPLSFGVIDLVAVGKNVQGRGIGQVLVSGALDWFRDKVDIVEVGTQVTNYTALHLYQKVGFKIILASFSLRKWFS